MYWLYMYLLVGTQPPFLRSILIVLGHSTHFPTELKSTYDRHPLRRIFATLQSCLKSKPSMMLDSQCALTITAVAYLIAVQYIHVLPIRVGVGVGVGVGVLAFEPPHAHRLRLASSAFEHFSAPRERSPFLVLVPHEAPDADIGTIHVRVGATD